MRQLTLLFLVAGLASACVSPASGAQGSYVYCDNGLRCIKAPCPSNNALELATGTVAKGVTIDTGRLPAGEKTQDLPDDLYAGKLVFRGFIETRTVTHTRKTYRLPYLVATAIERKATSAERRRCKAR